MTEGAGLRQSHFGSGYDAGKARLQAEVERLQDQVAHLTGYADGLKRGSDLHEQRREELEKQLAAQTAVVEAARESAGEGHREHCRVGYRHCTCSHEDLVAALVRLDAADVPEASTGENE